MQVGDQVDTKVRRDTHILVRVHLRSFAAGVRGAAADRPAEAVRRRPDRSADAARPRARSAATHPRVRSRTQAAVARSDATPGVRPAPGCDQRVRRGARQGDERTRRHLAAMGRSVKGRSEREGSAGRGAGVGRVRLSRRGRSVAHRLRTPRQHRARHDSRRGPGAGAVGLRTSPGGVAAPRARRLGRADPCRVGDPRSRTGARFRIDRRPARAGYGPDADARGADRIGASVGADRDLGPGRGGNATRARRTHRPPDRRVHARFARRSLGRSAAPKIGARLEPDRRLRGFRCAQSHRPATDPAPKRRN